MLPAAHLLPCLVLDTEPLESGQPAVRLQCHQDLLPLPESGPGYAVFQPVDDLAESIDDLDWPSLLTARLDRDSWWIPRSAILRTLTAEGQLAAFRMGDPHDLAPQDHQVEWSDGELITLRLRQPMRLATVLGPTPPPWPTFAMTRVAYELTPAEAQSDFARGAVELTPDHWRYVCWALATFPVSLADDPPRLPHQSRLDEAFDAVESWLVLDESPVALARSDGWQWAGEVWRNPATGALSDGAIFGVLRPREGRVRVEHFSFRHLDGALTALVPFDLEFAAVAALVQRWSNNLPLPELAPES